MMKRQTLLALSMASLTASMIAITPAYASDIDIYQTAKKPDVTLMFLIDISGSMMSNHSNPYYGRPACELSTTQDMTPRSALQTPIIGGPSYTRRWCEVTSGSLKGNHLDRMTRIKDGMIELLNGNPAKNITKIADDKIIGLSTLGATRGGASMGAIVVPARPLGTIVSGSKTQRQLLIEEVIGLSPGTSTPTARSYAETIAYLMGRSTSGQTGAGWQYSSESAKSGGAYSSPSSLTQDDEMKECSSQGIYVLTDGVPNENNPTSGLARQALGKPFTCTDSVSGWDCTEKMNEALLDPSKNIKNLKFKTAVVGFGSEFSNVKSYDRNKTKEENLVALGNGTSDVVRAARWGINGEGGWYSGNSSQDVVDSVNAFIKNMDPNIPSVITGSPTIPIDALNPSQVQTNAYYPQFKPTPHLAEQLWLGNLKKYKVVDGKLTDKASQAITDNTGRLLTNYDWWSEEVSPDKAIAAADAKTKGSTLFAQEGGVYSKLLLKASNTSTKEVNRKLFTNRVVTGSGTVTISENTTLTPIELDYLTKTGFKDDPARGYLMNLLGYDIDPKALSTLKIDDNLKKVAELRQVGAIMHSMPLLLTNRGTITYDEKTGQTGSKDREDYVLFGSTQGLLHVVDAESGAEKFAFLPNEMIEKQKEIFSTPGGTVGGANALYYGIDGPWTSYSEYVFEDDDTMTVNRGADERRGKQMVYGGLRMGGKSYYSLDLSDIEQPKMLFHIDPEKKQVHFGNTSKDFPALEYMGQSWSKPTIEWVRWNGERKRVMLVGGGYDAEGYNTDKTTGSSPTQNKGQKYRGYEYDNYDQTQAVVDVVKDGKLVTEPLKATGGGVYMFDADNGDLLWWTGSQAVTSTSHSSGVMANKNENLKYSVVSEIRAVDRDADGLVDHLYFGDLGGQVFRLDLNNGLKAENNHQFLKRSVRLLNVNSTEYSPRFYEMPAFSVYDKDGETFGVVSIGSGNRSSPLVGYEPNLPYKYDAVYNLYDKDSPRKRAELYDAATIVLKTPDREISGNHLIEITDENRFESTNTLAHTGTSGWYYQFKSSSALTQSEKVFSTPIVIQSDMYVNTFDGSKPGLVKGCGPGVRGESFATLFCMPYGQCEKNPTGANPITRDNARVALGVGNTAVSISGIAGDGGVRQVIAPNGEGGGLGGYKQSGALIVQRWYQKL